MHTRRIVNLLAHCLTGMRLRYCLKICFGMLLARQLSANVTDASRNISIMPRIDNRLDKKFSFDHYAAKTFIMNNSWDIFKNFYRCRWVSHKQPLQEWSNMYQFTRRLQVWLSKGMEREKLRPRWVCFSPFSYPSGLIKVSSWFYRLCPYVRMCITAPPIWSSQP